MADTGAVRFAVYNYLAANVGGVPIVSAYASNVGAVPRYEVEIVGEVNEPMLNGETIHRGEIQITAVALSDTGEGGFAPLVATIQNTLPAGLRIGGIAIERKPESRAPMLDGAEIRVPMAVRFKAIMA